MNPFRRESSVMEVLQCDGCDFRAESYDDLKAHIQDVHTAFLQPTAVGDRTPEPSRTDSLLSHKRPDEDEEEDLAALNEFGSSHDEAEPHSLDLDAEHFSSSNQITYSQSPSLPSKPGSQFYQCKFCVRYFRSKSLLSDHTKKVHSVAGGVSPSDRSSPPSQTSKQSSYSTLTLDGFGKVFSCQYCTYKSPRRARILKHQKMYHKGIFLDSPETLLESARDASSPAALPTQEPCMELPEEVVQRSILESMVKPLTKSRGNFSCEWCGYQTLRRERWCDHMMKKHRKMVKMISSIQQQECDGYPESPKPDSPTDAPSSSLMSRNLNGSESSSANTSTFMGSSGSPSLQSASRQADDFSSFQYSQKSKIPNSTGSSIMSDRSTFVMSDMSNSGIDFETNSVLDDSSCSSDDELDNLDDGEDALAFSADGSAKQLLSEEDNKMLETKGVPFRRYMNRFQCPFCSFLTMHRRSISRHIENIHLSGKTTVYKCDKCPFICTSPLKLGTHKQGHVGASSEWETVDESLCAQDEEAANGGNLSSKLNSRKPNGAGEPCPQNPHRCSLCSFSTTTLKGLRVHQQHKHSYCDDKQATGPEGSPMEQPESEPEACGLSNYVQKTQTSILGFSSRKHLSNKTARKSINDTPLDLSPVKKRTRIDEIASNLQSKISRSAQQEDLVINLEEVDDEEDEEESNEINKDNDDFQARQKLKNHRFSYQRQHMYRRDLVVTQEEGIGGKRKRSLQQKFTSSSAPIQLTISDDEDNENDYVTSVESKSLLDQADQDGRDDFQEGTDYCEDPETLFYCKHCDYHNKSARSVSTHYQRMHPYIKFSFRYILDPEDQSAVFRCLECYVEYATFDDLNQHYSENHPEAINVLNFNQPDLVYKCRFCLYTSSNVRSLMPHYQRMHPTVKINNAMIFSSYVVEPPHKETMESQTLREILNSGPKNFSSPSAGSKPSARSSLVHKSLSRTQESCTETDILKETNDVVVYDCDICSFASPNMHSVLVHYQKKHPEQKASYFRIQKTMRVISVDRPQASSQIPSDMSSSNPLKNSSAIPMEMDEEIFYCKHCIYSNRSVVGVLVHYQKRHPEIKVTAKYIKHAPPTPGLMKIMEELKIAPPRQFLKPSSNNGIDSSSARSSGDKGEAEMLFFCQHCDYGNRTVKGILIHYQKKHRDVRANADLVRRHTAVVRSQRERAQMCQAGNASVAAPAPDFEKTRPLRGLKCRHCSYTSPYVYALKKHLKKDHPTVKATAMTILHWAYQDGILEAGYHCEWCIYSHTEPNGLLMHYQRRHPEHNVDYTHMATKLWAGPDASASQQVGNSESKHYQCRDCAFAACSIWDITNHYQAVHPWAINGDDSVLLDIIKGNRSADKTRTPMAEVHVAMSSQFNSLPHEHAQESSTVAGSASRTVPHFSFASTSLSNSPYQCTVCFSEYNSLHGLLTHYGKKHPGMKVKAADFAQDTDINPGSVYKCRHCPYVNSRIHGVLTHYQKRHPQVKVTAEDFADDIEEVVDANEGDDKYKPQRQGYGAYRCKMCPYTHGTLEKLKVHYEKYHNQPASDMFNPSLPQLSAGKDEVARDGSAGLDEANDYRSAVSQFAVSKKEKHALFRCQLCKYFCSTRKGIARHYRIKHNNVRAQPEGKNNVFKCALCSYTNPIRKGLAAHYQKRHDIDAYYTHCLAASKTVAEKPSKVAPPAASLDEVPSVCEEPRLAVERRKCSVCSFQAFSRKSVVSHYLKHHPGVFPKKQQPSKLGRYFTVMLAEEPEDGGGKVEESPAAEQENEEQEWLPFRCAKCFKLSFSTADLLCMHYTDHHSRDLKRDFAALPGPEEDGADCYQCAHCDLRFRELLELGAHLTNHNDEFQKRAQRLERRKQLLSKQKGAEQLDAKPDKLDIHANKAPVSYRCNFCVEVHPTLRAICNHLRKHVQYGEVKAGHVKQEVTEVPVSEGVANGDAGPPGTSSAAAVAEKAGVARGRSLAGHPCRQCDRVFMSMQGLRSHERSHSAVAVAMSTREDKYSCQYCQFISPFRHNLDRHVQSHHGHHKPFRCKLCSFKSAYLSRLKSHLLRAHAGENTYRCLSCPFSTMTISQLKEHSLKIHGEALTLPKLRAATQTTQRPQRPVQEEEEEEQAPVTPELEECGYSEPPDVQQQICHYQQAAGRGLASPTGRSPASPAAGSPGLLLGSEPPPPRAEGALVCELCVFSSGYMQSLRRHYRDRHGGKKLYKCKECSFFTCYKSSFTMHVEAGHSSSPEEGPKDLRCPLCLYHTKYKSSMIDHIVLHREERVVPLEVCRSKLSRHLQGVVFRCHKCTFTCSSDENLRLHLRKHSQLKPYKCQLCFYDSRQREELETHLRLEHKVICNFELVGQVNLDQLEAMKDKLGGLSSAEEEEEEEEEEEVVEGEEVEDDQGEEEEEVERVELPKEAPGSPGSTSSTCSEKRFPCKFCGRVFTHCAEWERHVLRHGMTLTSSRVMTSQAVENSTKSDTVSLALEKGCDVMEVERGHPSDMTDGKMVKQEEEEEEEEETPETKNDP